MYKCCYNYSDEQRSAAQLISDPTEQSRWRPLRLLQAAMDDEIARIYAEAQIDGLKPSYVMEILRLHARGPMTITELARSVQRTHSAISQKVAAMRAAGLGPYHGGPGRPHQEGSAHRQGGPRRRPAGGRVAGHRGGVAESRRRSPTR